MLLSLVDVLRCPEPHESSSLVLTVHRWSGQRVAEGELGCPICRARYAIRDGITDFTSGPPREEGDIDGGGAVRPVPHGTTQEHTARLAAQLALGEPGGIVLLTGAYAVLHEALLDMVDATCVLVDAASSPSPMAATIQVRHELPLAAGVLRGAAVDRNRSSPSFIAEVARCLAGRGRLVAPASAAMPSGVQLLASDEREWVGEAVVSIPTVLLGRRRPG